MKPTSQAGSRRQPVRSRARRPLLQAVHGLSVAAPHLPAQEVHAHQPGEGPSEPERDTCRPWLARELELLRPALRAIVVLGGFAWQALLPVLTATGWQVPRPRPAFGHGAHAQLTDARSERVLHLIGGYHPSQRNVSTHTLTPAMLRDVLQRGADIADVAVRRPACG
ncbi:uracil-DNA glycosylase family protein [Streptomyces mirabilis]|uniref:uracil-DNA glycosylase family protein n=1 Tax=Streptomyces mirabilis TaxID=68239 RepID=UPI003723CE5C